jgi:hypothetical protein
MVLTYENVIAVTVCHHRNVVNMIVYTTTLPNENPLFVVNKQLVTIFAGQEIFPCQFVKFYARWMKRKLNGSNNVALDLGKAIAKVLKHHVAYSSRQPTLVQNRFFYFLSGHKVWLKNGHRFRIACSAFKKKAINQQ